MNPRILGCVRAAAVVALSHATFAQSGEYLYALEASAWPHLYRLDPNTAQLLEDLPTNTVSLGGLVYDGASLYSFTGVNPGVPDYLYQLRPSDGVGSTIGYSGFDWNWHSLKFHPLTGVLYLLADEKLYTIDRTSGAATLVAPLTGMHLNEGVIALFIDRSGHAYANGTFLYSVNLSTGVLTQLGGFTMSNGGLMWGWFDDFAYSSTGELWATFSGDLSHKQQSGLYRIDLASITATQVTSTPNSFFLSIAFARDCVPQNYCTAKFNSQFCLPSISYTGHPTFSGSDDFVLHAQNEINHKPGLLVWSLSPSSKPFGGGTLCVHSPIKRTPVQDAGGSALPTIDCSGGYSFAFTNAYAIQHNLTSADTIYAQFWSRDPDQPYQPSEQIALTDALSFSICP